MNNLSTVDKMAGSRVSLIMRSHCHTHIDNSLQHLHYDHSCVFPILHGNRSLDWSHYLYIPRHPTRWDQFLVQMQHNKKMRQLQEIPAVYRQLQHHSRPSHHHIQYPMYCCSILQHVQCLLHFHQQDGPWLHYVITNNM